MLVVSGPDGWDGVLGCAKTGAKIDTGGQTDAQE